MTPDQLAKSGSEHGHQVALFAWVAVAHNFGFEVADEWAKNGSIELAIRDFGKYKKPVGPEPRLKWFHAIPNGGSRGDDEKTRAIRGGALKAEGVKAGIADCFLPVPRYDQNAEFSNQIEYCGLYIEMKKPGKIKNTSEEQDEFAAYCRENNYGFIVCDTWQMARDALVSYLTY